MTTSTADLEARLSQFVEAHVLRDERLPVARLCAGRPDLEEPLAVLIEHYLSLTLSLDPLMEVAGSARAGPSQLPVFDGFETIERIGAGGMGEVYKLRDLRLGRMVAAKVIRQDRNPVLQAGFDGFLREARALALFSDRRIVQIFEARLGADPPVLIMEHVDGFELGRIGPSLDSRSAPEFWSRSARRCTMPTRWAFSTATSSRRTSCSTRSSRRAFSTSA